MTSQLSRIDEMPKQTAGASAARKLYVAPQLLVHGNLSKITQSGTGSVGDGTGGGKKPKGTIANPINSDAPRKKR